MSSSTHGTTTLVCEVAGIEEFGFWILVDDREYFVPFADYPVFRSATVAQIYAVERVGPDQLSWPALDADIEVAALDRPDAYPLTYIGQAS